MDEPGAPANVIGDRYAIEYELARGGMGIVYRVVDSATGEALALKRGLSGAAGKSVLSLEQEYRMLVTLRHPRIIRVYDFGIDADGPFYTMELLDGEDLRSRSPIDWRDVCVHLRDIASSLALLHSRRLLHRDISASNIRLTDEGRAKLIDFGTLTSFGTSQLIVGTPPLVAPETLEGAALDHRVDLYALGATAYYALTKRHAYAARKIANLKAFWSRGAPPAPSHFEPGIPKDLDDLVLSLLSLDRSLRPSSAAEVIDRFGAIAGLTPEMDDRVAQSYLVSHELIGRERELRRLHWRLERAREGRGSSVIVGSPVGSGKSMLLARFANEAKAVGTQVIAVNARAHQRPLGVWRALVERATSELPNLTASARRQLEVIHRRFERLEAAASPRETPDDALVGLFRSIAETAPLLVLVDDVHRADRYSLQVLLSFAKAIAAHRLLLVATFDTDARAAENHTLKLLRRGSGRLRLQPFGPEQTESFVRSLFGDLTAVKRLAAWLHEQTDGDPSLCTGLVTHFVKEGRIHYAEGTWVLPHEFPEHDVHAVLTAAVGNRLDRLRPNLRRFAECLSVHPRALTLELCEASAGGDPKLFERETEALVAELMSEGILIGDQGHFAFARTRLREALYSNLPDSRRRTLHRHAARILEKGAAGDPEKEFEVGWHLLLAGDRSGAFNRISLSVVDVVSRPDSLVRVVPQLRDLHREYQRHGGTTDEVLLVTASLVVSGYYVDPSTHDEFGDETAEVLQERAGFALAARLIRWLGAYPALFVGLLWGLVQYVWSTRSIRIHLFGGVVLSFVGVCAARSAVGYLRLEQNTHALLLRLLSPAKSLHKHNGLRVVHDLIGIAFAECSGAYGDVRDGYVDQLARLPHVRLFTDEARHHYEAGLLCSFGRCHLLRMGDGALQCATRVDAMGGQHDRVLAQFLRCSYHLYRGEITKAEQAHEVLDVMAAQYGYRWVPDILAVLDFVPYHLSADVVGLKRVLHRTERVLPIAPTYAVYRGVIHSMYEGHRGHPDIALAHYEENQDALRPFMHPVWSFACAHRAECFNAVGRHEEALDSCREALRHVGSLARDFPVAYQQLEREGALALASIGRVDEAARWLDELLEFHMDSDHPLLIGLLHRDRARVAQLQADSAAFERHANAARFHFERTDNPGLLNQARHLVGLTETVESPSFQSATTTVEESVRLFASLVGAPLPVLARRALEQVVRLTGASRAYLYLLHDGVPSLAARLGNDGAAPPLEAKVQEFMATLANEARTTQTCSIHETCTDLLMLPLSVARGGLNQPVGVIAAFGCRESHDLTGQHLEQIAVALQTSATTIVEGKWRSLGGAAGKPA